MTKSRLLRGIVERPLDLTEPADICRFWREQSRLDASVERHRTRRYVRAQPVSFVYVIRLNDGPVKIGTSVDPAKRLSSLRTGNPTSTMTVEAVMLGSREIEQWMHKRYANARFDREWFDAGSAEAIVRHVRQLSAGQIWHRQNRQITLTAARDHAPHWIDDQLQKRAA